jgi:hypothetical protein
MRLTGTGRRLERLRLLVQRMHVRRETHPLMLVFASTPGASTLRDSPVGPEAMGVGRFFLGGVKPRRAVVVIDGYW